MNLQSTRERAGPADEAGPADDRSFEAFYRSHVDRVYRALALTLGNVELAREATDEAMARAYARWDRLSTYDNPGGWVYRVGSNWGTSWWQKLRRERPMPEHPMTAAAAGDPAGQFALEALGRLPRPQRAVVVCRVLLDLSTAETATALGIAEGTVKSRLARGLAALRGIVTEERG
ncbi:sigma factor-like helix-turn-helix DNA-binding protein [Phytohabitans aurantiacus]|jgi:DNA-directed RNA polymerase specialized sigma24 family protein|uniref:RNA polymerase sigma factor n=1 Tax=Phytohabitans aurantiacus TaxID=3016789 RepID=A0ABQ5QZK6_9ACTN|nr:sigma factor-like helix-turn-helix DNA-binding protein [Phytohabitans aurantiacus]GLH99342.1 RNA polymerase sigma factor [Phytohabitans aurantiacus]